MSFKGKTFIVTGAASGIGHATAQALVVEGANVAICDLAAELLDKVTHKLDSHSTTVLAKVVDITDREAIRAFIEDAKDKFGTIDGVANVAGVGGRELATHDIWDISEKEYDFVIDVNVRGCFNVLSESLRPGVLVEGASVVHIGSMFSLQGFHKGAVFAASKHAALGMVRSAAKDAGPRVRVNMVLPGVIDTPLHRANLQRIPDFVPAPSTPISRDGKAQEVADVTMFLLSDKSTFVTGAAWSVDGGANA